MTTFTKRDVSNSYAASLDNIPVAQITIGSGASAISFQGMILADSDGNVLATLPIGGAVTVTSGNITADTELPTAAALADGESNATAVPEVGARMMGFNGTTWDRAQLAQVMTSAPAGTEKGVVTRNIPSGTQPASIASGQVASGAIASGAIASGSIVDGAVVTLGVKADAKSTATDTTAITIMSVLKQISASVQAPPSQAVTNAGTFAVQQSALTAATNATSQLTLTSSATAYQPTAPASPYLLVLSNNSDTDMKWGYATCTATGIFLAKSGGTVAMIMAASKAPFVNCASAGKVLDYTTTIL
jgi:hypothetical protein